MSTTQILTADRLRADVADLLGLHPAALAGDESLLEQGLDSVRLMSLVERWRALGAPITFAELAERPTLDEWNDLIFSRG